MTNMVSEFTDMAKVLEVPVSGDGDRVVFADLNDYLTVFGELYRGYIRPEGPAAEAALAEFEKQADAVTTVEDDGQVTVTAKTVAPATPPPAQKSVPAPPADHDAKRREYAKLLEEAMRE